MTTAATAVEPAPVPRLANLQRWMESKSYFLFGPRQTGKTFLIRQALPRARIYDLLGSEIYLALSQRGVLAPRILTGGDTPLPVLVAAVARLGWALARLATTRGE